MSTGSLIVVGTGIHLVGDLTLATKAWIEQADKLLFAVADPATAKWLRTLNAETVVRVLKPPIFSSTGADSTPAAP